MVCGSPEWGGCQVQTLEPRWGTRPPGTGSTGPLPSFPALGRPSCAVPSATHGALYPRWAGLRYDLVDSEHWFAMAGAFMLRGLYRARPVLRRQPAELLW